MPSVDDSKRSALQLSREIEQHIALDWPDTPPPSVGACKVGVRFGCYVPVETETDTEALAATLQQFWKSKGLEVPSSRTDFGGDDGVRYSATADEHGAAGPLINSVPLLL